MLYSINQVAERVGVSPSTVSGWIQRGELRALNYSLNANSKKPRWRISDEDLTDFDRRRQNIPPMPTAPPPQQPQPKRRRRKSEDVIQIYH